MVCCPKKVGPMYFLGGTHAVTTYSSSRTHILYSDGIHVGPTYSYIHARNINSLSIYLQGRPSPAQLGRHHHTISFRCSKDHQLSDYLPPPVAVQALAFRGAHSSPSFPFSPPPPFSLPPIEFLGVGWLEPPAPMLAPPLATTPGSKHCI